jgi:hypothetical protein
MSRNGIEVLVVSQTIDPSVRLNVPFTVLKVYLTTTTTTIFVASTEEEDSIWDHPVTYVVIFLVGFLILISVWCIAKKYNERQAKKLEGDELEKQKEIHVRWPAEAPPLALEDGTAETDDMDVDDDDDGAPTHEPRSFGDIGLISAEESQEDVLPIDDAEAGGAYPITPDDNRQASPSIFMNEARGSTPVDPPADLPPGAGADLLDILADIENMSEDPLANFMKAHGNGNGDGRLALGDREEDMA